jgi:hypothetical protein
MDDEAAGCLVWVVLLAGALVWYWGWESALRYSLQYNVELSQVSVETKPKDCDFLHAPLGQKDCHYEKVVSILRFGRNPAGQPIVSYDDGQHWWLNNGGPESGGKVDVSWTKKAP